MSRAGIVKGPGIWRLSTTGIARKIIKVDRTYVTCGGGGRGAGGRTSEGWGAKWDKAGAVRETKETTETTEALTSGRRRITEDLPVGTQDDGAGGK